MKKQRGTTYTHRLHDIGVQYYEEAGSTVNTTCCYTKSPTPMRCEKEGVYMLSQQVLPAVDQTHTHLEVCGVGVCSSFVQRVFVVDPTRVH